MNLKHHIELFLIALQFLTRLPVGTGIEFTTVKMNQSAAYYPLVGAVIGTIAAGLLLGFSSLFPYDVSIVLTIAAIAFLTGCFHEDGFADMCDGIGGGADKDRALEIMRDSRLGTYGVVGLIFLIAIKLIAITHVSFAVVPALMIGAHAISRLSAVMIILTSDYVRLDGAAKPVAEGPSNLNIIVGTGFLVVFVSCIWIGTLVTFTSLVAAAAGHLLVRRTFEKKLGGYTGDCLGATQQVTEVSYILGALICL